MFVHWGLYSLHGEAEWDWFESRTPFADYAQLADRFNPEKFNADEWVDIAAAVGRRYIIVTTTAARCTTQAVELQNHELAVRPRSAC